MPVATGRGWLTPSPPDGAAFHARSMNGVKFIFKSVELFNMKVPLLVLGLPLMWHLLPSVAALLTFKASPWIPAMQKGQHFPSKCIPTAWGAESSWAKGQKLQAVWELLSKPAACPPQGGKGDPGSSAPCRWRQFRPKEKNKVNYLYLALNLWLLGDNCVFFPLYPLIQAASERKTKNLTKNSTEGFPW